jgi:hypothetical protein
VSGSRLPDWRRSAPGGASFEGRLLIPDWLAVARRYDAVHLTPAAYFTAAGRLLPVEPGVATMIAGWGPDATYWLTGTPPLAAPVELRRFDSPDIGWP